MTILMKLTLSLGVLAAALLGVVAPASAQTAEWPERPVTITIGFGPGSGTDLVARVINQPLGDLLGQSVVIQNVGGAGGLLGVTRVARAAPDGYNLVVGAVDTFGQGPLLRKQPPYDPRKDFDPAGLAVVQPLILIVRKNLPVNTLKEFADYVRANHAKMQFGSAGVGSATHLVCSQLTKAMGASVTHVSYRGSAEAMQDLLTGNLDFYCALASTAMAQLSVNNVRAIAVLTRERSAVLPDLPTAKEQGFDVGDFYYWMGLFFPKDTPQPIVKKLNTALSKVLDRPDVQARLKDFATTVVPAERRSPDYLRTYLDSEIELWGKLIKEGNIPQN